MNKFQLNEKVTFDKNGWTSFGHIVAWYDNYNHSRRKSIVHYDIKDLGGNNHFNIEERHVKKVNNIQQQLNTKFKIGDIAAFQVSMSLGSPIRTGEIESVTTDQIINQFSETYYDIRSDGNLYLSIPEIHIISTISNIPVNVHVSIKPPGCNHKWKKYIGLGIGNTFDYCDTCGVKK